MNIICPICSHQNCVGHRAVQFWRIRNQVKNGDEPRCKTIIGNVLENVSIQSTLKCRESYFKSCENHGGELAEITAVARKEF